MFSLILSYDVTGLQDSIAIEINEGGERRTHSKLLTSDSVRGNSQRQSALLIPELKDLLENVGHTFQDVTTLCVLTGPGSFTGIRIGLATAQGLLLAHPCEIFAPTALEVLRYMGMKAFAKEEVLAIIDTKRRDYFALDTQSNQPIILSPQEVIDYERRGYRVVSSVPEEICPNGYIPKESIADGMIYYYHSLTAPARTQTSLTPFYLRNPEFVKKKQRKDAP